MRFDRRALGQRARTAWRVASAPGDLLLRNVRVSIKFVIVGAALLAPLLWLTGSYMSAQNSQIEFSRKEITGVEQLRPLTEVFVAAVAARHHATAGLEPVALDALIGAVDITEQDELDTLTGWREVRAALLAAGDAGTGRAAQAVWDDAIEGLRHHIIDVGDRSNLTLDPDIDTYYLMDAVQFRMPTLVEALGNLQTEAVMVAAESRSATEGELRRAPIGASLARELQALDEGLTKIDAATASPAVLGAVGPTFERVRAVAEGVVVDPPTVAAPLEVTAIGTHWDALATELETLIGQRVGRLEDRARFAVTVTVVSTLAALYLFTVLAASVTRPVHRTIGALHRAAEGRLPDPMPVVGADEFAQLTREANGAMERIARTQARMEHQATHDMLTGLPNRRFVMQRLDDVVTALPHDGAALCFIDLDRFKAINDTLGHHAGDQTLLAVARRLTVMLGPDDVAARLAGDEFVLLLVGCGDDDELEAFVQLVVQVLERPVPLTGPTGPTAAEIGASIGVARIEPWMTPDEVLRRADTAMYDAKRDGGDTYRIFPPTPLPPAQVA